MATSQATNEMVSEASDDYQPRALDRFFEPHKIIGTDAEGRVHHYHADFDREYTFEDGGRVYVVEPETGLEHVEDLDGVGIDVWMDFIGHEVCGWETVKLLTINADLFEAAGLGGLDR